MSVTRAGARVLDELRVEQGLDPKLPWGGRSPRVLTRAYKRFNFSQETAPVDDDFDEDYVEEQYRRFHNGS